MSLTKEPLAALETGSKESGDIWRLLRAPFSPGFVYVEFNFKLLLPLPPTLLILKLTMEDWVQSGTV